MTSFCPEKVPELQSPPYMHQKKGYLRHHQPRMPYYSPGGYGGYGHYGVPPPPPPPPPSTPSLPTNDASSSSLSRNPKYWMGLLNKREEELARMQEKLEAAQAALQEQSIETAQANAKLEQRGSQHEKEKEILRLTLEMKHQKELKQVKREAAQALQQSLAEAAVALSSASPLPPPRNPDSSMDNNMRRGPALTRSHSIKTVVLSNLSQELSPSSLKSDDEISDDDSDTGEDNKNDEDSSMENDKESHTTTIDEKATPTTSEEGNVNKPPAEGNIHSRVGQERERVEDKTVVDPYGDKGMYSGVVFKSSGMPHGLGRMQYEDDGRIYVGDWSHGRWHGYGRATFHNGDSYQGELSFDQRHGHGVYRWQDGRVYDGMFSEDIRHGHGVLTWPDGAVFDGEFINGQRSGRGKYVFADGGSYEGGWKDGMYDGFGVCTWGDGRRYRGEWKNGMADGNGVETYPNGNIRHEGMWANDKPVRD